MKTVAAEDVPPRSGGGKPIWPYQEWATIPKGHAVSIKENWPHLLNGKDPIKIASNIGKTARARGVKVRLAVRGDDIWVIAEDE